MAPPPHMMQGQGQPPPHMMQGQPPHMQQGPGHGQGQGGAWDYKSYFGTEDAGGDQSGAGGFNWWDQPGAEDDE